MTSETLHIDSFIYGLKAQTREQVLQAIAWKAGRVTSTDISWLADQLLMKEQREHSGIDGGVAIPHLKSTPLDKPHIVLARLATPVDFGAMDGEPVDLVCTVFSPKMDGVLHLRRLARVTRLFRESFVLERLRAATSEQEMADFINYTQARTLEAA